MLQDDIYRVCYIEFFLYAIESQLFFQPLLPVKGIGKSSGSSFTKGPFYLWASRPGEFQVSAWF